MTSGSIGETPAPPPPASAPKPNLFARISGVLFSPTETFKSIAQRPDWVVPLVLWMLVSLAGGIIMAQKVDFGAAARQAMEGRKDVPPDAVERSARVAAGIGKVFTYAAPAFAAIIFLIVAAVLLLAFRLFGSDLTFPQAFSSTLYAWVPNIIQSVILFVVILARGTVDPATLQSVVRSNLAFLVDPKTNPLVFSGLASLDAFKLWTLILFIFGFSASARVSKGKSAMIIVPLWLLTVLFSLIPAAMRSMR